MLFRTCSPNGAARWRAGCRGVHRDPFLVRRSHPLHGRPDPDGGSAVRRHPAVDATVFRHDLLGADDPESFFTVPIAPYCGRRLVERNEFYEFPDAVFGVVPGDVCLSQDADQVVAVDDW